LLFHTYMYISKERTIFVCYQFFKQLERKLEEENQSTLMALYLLTLIR
jgi:hypothetical protein